MIKCFALYTCFWYMAACAVVKKIYFPNPSPIQILVHGTLFEETKTWKAAPRATNHTHLSKWANLSEAGVVVHMLGLFSYSNFLHWLTRKRPKMPPCCGLCCTLSADIIRRPMCLVAQNVKGWRQLISNPQKPLGLFCQIKWVQFVFFVIPFLISSGESSILSVIYIQGIAYWRQVPQL